MLNLTGRIISHIKGKLSRGIGIICKARKVLKKETFIKLYYSFGGGGPYSTIEYGPGSIEKLLYEV